MEDLTEEEETHDQKNFKKQYPEESDYVKKKKNEEFDGSLIFEFRVSIQATIMALIRCLGLLISLWVCLGLLILLWVCLGF